MNLGGDSPWDMQAIASALPAAIDRSELTLAYQPQVCLTSGKIIGAEALLRWYSPQLGQVPPDVFVPLAESSGHIVTLGRWVMEEACRQTAIWRQAGLPSLRMTVNVSPAQFLCDDIASLVNRCLGASGLPAEAFGIEITEHALMKNAEAVGQALYQLQTDGVEIALDDFGTGYSSLSRLRELPIDLVKIDRSFVHDISTAATQASITRSVIHLAHDLHLRVLAEGVETEEQLLLLLEHGCDRLQGWYFSKAVDAAAFGQLLASGCSLPQERTHRREHQRTLMLVDDEEHILSALRRLFRRDGYRVLCANSGEQALEILGTQPVDVIISDQRMPSMTGVEFLRLARQMHADTIRMTLSGYTDMQSIIDAVNEGAVYKFLTKPWDDDRLRAHVAQAFEARELLEENRRLARNITVANADLAEANRRLNGLANREHARVTALVGAADASRALVDLMPVAAFGFDPAGLLVYANQAALELAPDWAIGLGAEVAAPLRQLLEQARQSGDKTVCVEIGGRHLTAQIKTLRDRQSPFGEVLMLTAQGMGMHL